MLLNRIAVTCRFVVAAIVASTVLSSISAATPAPGPVHSIAEFEPLIGHWTCAITEAGQADKSSSVDFDWLFHGKTLREHVIANDYEGFFFTTYDKRANTFKGVAVGSDGGYIVWENAGLIGGRSTEVGYLFSAGSMSAVSRTNFEQISPTHYVIRDFSADANGVPGHATDTEDCTKR